MSPPSGQGHGRQHVCALLPNRLADSSQLATPSLPRPVSDLCGAWPALAACWRRLRPRARGALHYAEDAKRAYDKAMVAFDRARLGRGQAALQRRQKEVQLQPLRAPRRAAHGRHRLRVRKARRGHPGLSQLRPRSPHRCRDPLRPLSHLQGPLRSDQRRRRSCFLLSKNATRAPRPRPTRSSPAS